MNTQLCFEGFSLMDEDSLLDIDGGGLLDQIAKVAVAGLATFVVKRATTEVVTAAVGAAIGGPVGYLAGCAVGGIILYYWG